VPVQALRVNFKEDRSDHSTPPSKESSAHAEGNHSEWAGKENDSEQVSPARFPPHQLNFGCSYEESPNYIPNWNRPITRQGCRRDKRAQTAAVSAHGPPGLQQISGLDGFEGPLLPAARQPPVEEDAVFRKSGKGFIDLSNRPNIVQGDDVSPVSPSDIGDKLRLLKKSGSRSRSQGSCRSSISCLGQRLDSASMTPDKNGDEGLVFVDLEPARASSPLSFGIEDKSRLWHNPLVVEPADEEQADQGYAAASPSISRRVRRMSEPQQDTDRVTSSAESKLLDMATSSNGTNDHLRSQPRRPRGPAKGLSDGAILYLDGEDLPPFDRAPTELWLDDRLRSVRSSPDWITQFEAITDLRRVARFAPHMLSASSSLRQAVESVLALVDSLRSSIAKGALICLHDLFLAYRKQMDVELDRCTIICLKKAAETNGLISEEAERTLMAMCQNVSESRGLAAILNLSVDGGRVKNPRLRAKCAWCLIMLIQRVGPRLHRHGESERLLQMLARMAGDAASEVRHLAKLGLASFQGGVGGEEFERLLTRCISSSDAVRIRQMLDVTPERKAAEAHRFPAGEGSPSRRSRGQTSASR